MGSGITSPKILQSTPAVYPNEAPPEGHGSCFLGMTIGVDGVPFDVRVLSSRDSAFEAAAIEAVKQSKFQAGSVGEKPVPVRIYVHVHFSADRSPAVPTISEFVPSNHTPPRLLYTGRP